LRGDVFIEWPAQQPVPSVNLQGTERKNVTTQGQDQAEGCPTQCQQVIGVSVFPTRSLQGKRIRRVKIRRVYSVFCQVNNKKLKHHVVTSQLT